MPNALVIGAGPAGLAAAACLKREGVAFRWVDRDGLVGGAYRRVYGPMRLASPARYSALPGLPLEVPGEYVTAAELREYFALYATKNGLAPEKAFIESITRIDGLFSVSSSGAPPERYQAVVVATGMFDYPRASAIPGLDPARARHAHDWRGPELYKGKKLLIVGGRTSGVELAEEAARAGVYVVVSAKDGKVKTVPQKILGRDVHDFAVLVERLAPLAFFRSFCARHPALPGTDIGFWSFVEAGKIRVAPEATRCEGARVFFADGSNEEFDAVVMATGYDFATPFLPPEAARARGGESLAWPGLYLIGFPCARALDSEFIRGIARDAPIVARRVRFRLAS